MELICDECEEYMGKHVSDMWETYGGCVEGARCTMRSDKMRSESDLIRSGGDKIR